MLEAEQSELERQVDTVIQTSFRFKESAMRKNTRATLKAFAVIVGAVAGVPWINAAKDAVHIEGIDEFVVACLIVSYGTTTAWAGMQIVDQLIEPLPENSQSDASKTQCNATSLKHILINALGVTVLIPTIYTSIHYNNDKLYYAPIAASVNYFFATFGFYNLASRYIGPFITQCLHAKQKSPSGSEQKEQCAGYIRALAATLNTADMANLATLSQAEFWQLCRDKAKEQSDINKKYPNQRIALKALLMPTIPSLNLIVRAVMTYNGLSEIFDSMILKLIFSGLVGTAYLGLDLFSMNRTADTVISKFAEHKHCHNVKDTIGSGAVLILCLAICLSSTISDAYITHEEIKHSSLSQLAMLFTIAMWISKTALQTIALSDTAGALYGELSACFNPQKKQVKEKRRSLTFFAGNIDRMNSRDFSDDAGTQLVSQHDTTEHSALLHHGAGREQP